MNKLTAGVGSWCMGAVLAAGLVALAGCVAKTGIQVVSATYGASCGGPAGNATADLKDKCQGAPACDYTVSVTVLGDPKQGCKKEYEAKWTCGSDAEIHTAALPGESGFNGKVRLACPTNK